MTTYELAKSIPADMRKKLSDSGLMPQSVERHLYIYECYAGLIASGLSKMDAYERVSCKCFTSVENVRKIIQKMDRLA